MPRSGFYPLQIQKAGYKNILYDWFGHYNFTIKWRWTFNYNIYMGKKITLKVDKTLDRDYPAGSIVVFQQHANTKLGLATFTAQAPLYDYHGELANKAFRSAFRLNKKVLELPVEKPSNMRRIDDKMLAKLYMHGSMMIENVYIMFEHLTRYMLGAYYLPGKESDYYAIENKELKGKLSHVLQILNRSDLKKSTGYGVLFSELERARHAINHPKFKTIYSADESNWDTVPIAWIVAGKHLDAFHEITGFHRSLMETWDANAPNLKKPGTLTALQPIVSGVHTQIKKPSL